MKIYCQECGLGMNYTTAKPNFCSKCGKPLGLTDLNAKEDSEEELEELENNEYIPNIQSLDVDIVPFGPVQVQKISDVLENQPKTPQNTSVPILDNQIKQSDADFLRDFQKEAGTTRKNE